MADNSGILRDYRISDGDLALFSNSLVLAMTRDLAELGLYSVTNLKIDELNTLIDEFQAMPDNEILRTDLSYAIELRDLNKNAVLNTMRSIAVRAKAVTSQGTIYSNELSFTTIPTLPVWGLIVLGGLLAVVGGWNVWRLGVRS